MPTTTLTTAAGLEFTVDVAGPADGEPVLFLHGFPQSRYAWRRQIEALAGTGYRCVAPDQRGYSPGARPAGTEAYALSLLARDALDLMDTLGAERFHLVGHDWGGRIAWYLAAIAPDRVRSLAVFSRPHPAAFAEALERDPEQPARSGHHKRLLQPDAAQSMRADDFAALRESYRRHGVPEDSVRAYLDTLRPPGALEAAIEWYRASAQWTMERDLLSPRIPVLYAWGNEDHTVGRFAAEATARHVKGRYTFVEIDGGGHFITDQRPEEVSALLLAHLRAPAASTDAVSPPRGGSA